VTEPCAAVFSVLDDRMYLQNLSVSKERLSDE
jgi:hypothetical protein